MLLLLWIVGATSRQVVDWLVNRVPNAEAELKEACWYDEVCGLELTNGVVSRRFVTEPAFGTIDVLLHASAGTQSLLRAIEPEARVVVDGVDYAVGGLNDSSRVRAYMNRTELAARLTVEPGALRYAGHRVRKPEAPFPWTPGTRHALQDVEWPPSGLTLEVDFEGAANATLFYELYDGVPIMSKWMQVSGSSGRLEHATVELLAAAPPFGPYLTHGSFAPGSDWCGAPDNGAPLPRLHVKTDQAHGAACVWQDDYDASSDPVQGCETCKDQGAVEPLLNCSYETGPGVNLTLSNFSSFRALSIVLDSSELERATLARHRLTQLLAPHTTENPVFFHATDSDHFEHAIDQMVEVGFEMLIFSFGSGFDLESQNQTYLDDLKTKVDYATARGIEVGGYDLIDLERGHGGYGASVPDEWSAVEPDGSLSKDACFASGWADELEATVFNFLNVTGMTMLETDGPYGGGPCACTNHSHHEGLADSVYQQTQLQSDFFKKLRAQNVYINQPDNYFFQGGSRTGMGYDEQQFSLHRFEDLAISRQGLYDDLYTHLPTQGWEFVPIIDYHAGGPAATFDNHALAFDWALAQYLGAGTAACYRGPHLWDNTTAQGAVIKQLLLKWVNFYKAHRQTLIQPVVHLRRPDLQSWDGWLHVNPFSSTADVGVALLFNPTRSTLNVDLRLPLYYTGLVDDALITINDRTPQLLHLNRDFSVHLNFTALPRSIHTIVVQRPHGVDDRHSSSSH